MPSLIAELFRNLLTDHSIITSGHYKNVIFGVVPLHFLTKYSLMDLWPYSVHTRFFHGPTATYYILVFSAIDCGPPSWPGGLALNSPARTKPLVQLILIGTT